MISQPTTSDELGYKYTHRMKVIPVIDFYQGQVVLAKHGHRGNYRPINSRLSENSDPVSIVESILSITEFNTIYIADLDSIENSKPNHSVWNRIFQQFSSTKFWLDIGHQVDEWTTFYANTANASPVIGSESLNSLDQFRHVMNAVKNFSPVLSLDFKNSGLLGPASFADSSMEWPDNIIVLNLDQVGSLNGPDFSTLKKVTAFLPPKCHIYLGGGIRDTNDLRLAREHNIAGVLIASALHNRNINRDDLEEFTC